MEPGNPLLDEYVLSLCRRKKPRVCFFPSASGDADHYVVRFYRHFSSDICDPSHISLFRRDCGPGQGARAPAQAGPDLRRRRLDPVAARRLAGARDRRGSARRVAGGCHPCRRVRRLALLVRLRPHGLPPRRQALRGARLPPALQRGALRGGVQPPAGVPRRAAGRTDARWIRGLGRRGTALRRRGPAPGRALAPARRARTGSRPSATRSSSSRWRRPISASGRRSPLPPRKRPDDPRDGRGRLHDGAGEPRPRRLRARRSPKARRCRGSACCRPRRATARRRSASSTRPSARAPASRCTSRCSGSAAARSRCARRCSTQDIIYVGGGSMLGLLAVWRALGLDVILRECWEAGVVLAGLSAGAMCWFEWGVTKSLGHPAPSPGLGFLPGSMSVHMDGEPARLPVCRARDRRRHDPARLRRRRRRRAAVPRHRARGGRQLAPRPPRAAHRPRRRGPSSSRACSRARTASARRPRSPSSAASARSRHCGATAAAWRLRLPTCPSRRGLTPSSRSAGAVEVHAELASSGPWAARRVRKSSQSRRPDQPTSATAGRRGKIM